MARLDQPGKTARPDKRGWRWLAFGARGGECSMPRSGAAEAVSVRKFKP
jgi:hypothetical protein